ncbi:glucose-1-phosphate cytidylyltransferase [Clostridium botulinum B2 128]|uniref:glucose-1-phosphate cytidylyltransferase n=1 Tax=Clostridium botulinum TaxID=1491 RepID=UPI0007DFD876|nr:glucose-1-phosphate cytidylyltransferase [Clostridium botulinum]KEI76692.1 glucose-1-phosphate cytidylyltransferase [Clostridium botulinum B2 128]NFI43652.1 glucose-1-phosphate cytidylyltransferase [Clostridium botulinum]NFI77408.1 glucose-1-phosphate cytidylyltransferase [Clostridium botulinum]NFI84899.1 glucose-1-phosphate cytidylyltransferase [Clostridium botulinum]NFJ38446.1 glucose-1-phosphate cytidylyltransferase [Clostridium botulinum]
MKAVILAGGFGTRITEETVLKPKPMVDIGGKPVIWHIMNIYSNYNINDFIICCGYKGYMIKEYFANYHTHMSDMTVDLHSGDIRYYNSKAEPWKITLIDTGINTMTGGRLKRVKDYIGNETFMLTYGDGVSDVNVDKLLDFHKSSGKIATVTAVQPEGRFGALNINKNGQVDTFVEKPIGDGGWINGGFFVLEPEIFNYLKDDSTVLEKEPLQNLTEESQLNAYKHEGFWKPMDTLRDKLELEKLWENGRAPWKIWD